MNVEPGQPEQIWSRSTGSVDGSISAGAQRGDKTRGPTDQKAPSEGEAGACRQQRREATALSALFSGRDAQAKGVPGDVHKRNRHGTAKTTTMPRKQLADVAQDEA